MQKGAVIPEHGHKHFEETYVVSGVIDCAGTTLETGDYVRVNDEEKHSVTETEDAMLLVIVHQGVVVDGITDGFRVRSRTLSGRGLLAAQQKV